MRSIKPIIPEKALQRTAEKYPSGKKHKTFHYLNGKKVGRRIWNEDGSMFIECAMKDGVDHGRFRHFDPEGWLIWEGSCLKGKHHGVTRQFDRNGKVIGKTRMHHGTGADLWYSYDGLLSEERYIVDCRWNGFERWWNEDQRSVWEETHFKNDLEHGVRRKWNSEGKLKRGFPRYFINGHRVTKQQYFSACRHDVSLPKFSLADNAPYRKLPLEIQSNRRFRK
jgi:antitoxin component YwqK of YwqJK toxin-antitoxin module